MRLSVVYSYRWPLTEMQVMCVNERNGGTGKEQPKYYETSLKKCDSVNAFNCEFYSRSITHAGYCEWLFPLSCWRTDTWIASIYNILLCYHINKMMKSKCSVSKLVNWHMIFWIMFNVIWFREFCGRLSYLEYEQ